MTVRPGDLLHGDENGIVSVPQACLEQLPEAVAKVLERERTLLEFVRQPGFTSAKLRNRFFH
jgi:regulator of RNase E activity RraA